MIITVKNESPFQILTGAFTIGPSPTGYELQVGATPESFTTLFSVGANTPRMVTNVANGSYYRLKNNAGDVQVNWSRTCVTEGGGGSFDPTVLEPYWTSAQTKDYVDGAVSGISVDLSDYYTSAQTEEAITSKNYVTSAQVETQIVAKNYITSADTANYVTSGQVETQIVAKNYVNSGDVKSQVEAYNYATVSQIPTVPTSNTAFTNDAGYITDAAIENLVTSAQVETQIVAKNYASAADVNDLSGVVQEQQIVFSSGYNELHTQVLELSGRSVDLSAYYTSAQTENAITSKNYVTSAQVETQITSKGYATVSQIPTVPTSNTAFTNDAGYITSADTANFVTSGQVETQIVSKHYTASSNQSVLNIIKIEQSDYDALVAQSATTSTTLYVVVPDSQ